MARIVPNDKTWVGFLPYASLSGTKAAPNLQDILNATDLTPWVISITAQTQGNTVPTPTLDSTFETNIQGTVSASFTADFYRDDATTPLAQTPGSPAVAGDTAWTTLPRSTRGYFFISRFGGTGTNSAPVGGQTVEVWPVIITSRSASALASNTAQTFTVTAAVFDEPADPGTVASGTAVPTSVRNLTASINNTAASASVPQIILDWDTPLYVGSYGSAVDGSTDAKTAYDIEVNKVSTFNDANWFKIGQVAATSATTSSVHVASAVQALNTAPAAGSPAGFGAATSAGIAFTTSQGTGKTLYFRVRYRNTNGLEAATANTPVVTVANFHG